MSKNISLEIAREIINLNRNGGKASLKRLQKLHKMALKLKNKGGNNQ
jgi:ribosomal protein S7